MTDALGRLRYYADHWRVVGRIGSGTYDELLAIANQLESELAASEGEIRELVDALDMMLGGMARMVCADFDTPRCEDECCLCHHDGGGEGCGWTDAYDVMRKYGYEVTDL